MIDFEEFFYMKEEYIYKIMILKHKSEITIECKSYKASYSLNDLSILFKREFNNIDHAYESIINIFDENNFSIVDPVKNKTIKLVIEISNNISIQIVLIYNKNNKNFILNEINTLKNEIDALKKETEILKQENNKNINEINELKSNINNEINDIKLLSDIADDSYAYIDLDNTFSAFKSIDNILYLIYADREKSIISYDLIKHQKISKIYSNHSEYITNFVHFLDKINNRDLIMSISSKNNNIKIWNIKNWECILNMCDVYKKGWLFSACFISEKNNNYIITSNCNGTISESIRVYDFKGKKIKEIKNSKDETLFITTFYDKDFSRNYILTGNCNYVKSYDYDKNELYHIYSDNKNGNHYSIVIKEDRKIKLLIESCLDGYIRIWDFHSTSYLNKIKISNECLTSLCLWNNDYLFVGCSDKTIKVINLKTGLIPMLLKGHSDEVLTIKKIFHPTYGECLISQGWGHEKIKLWIKN